jgi:hypothetical protein
MYMYMCSCVNARVHVYICMYMSVGKTRVLAHRAARFILQDEIPPWQVLMVTFTNRAVSASMGGLCAPDMSGCCSQSRCTCVICTREELFESARVGVCTLAILVCRFRARRLCDRYHMRKDVGVLGTVPFEMLPVVVTSEQRSLARAVLSCIATRRTVVCSFPTARRLKRCDIAWSSWLDQFLPRPAAFTPSTRCASGSCAAVEH